MGRRNILPDDTTTPCKLRMERLRWIGGDYDQWGTYWGNGNGTAIYCAWGELEYEPGFLMDVRVFVRAGSRKQAKYKVSESLPSARFYR